jgi:hypothetical protein
MNTIPNNLFDSYSKKLAQDFDEALAKNDLPQTNELISRAEADLENHDIASQANLCYSIGTSYGNMNLLDPCNSHEKHYEKQLFYLQKAIDLLSKINNKSSDSMPFLVAFLLSLYTNYGNALEDCGRRIPALHYYHLAMTLNPRYAMAMGNAGITYFNYAALLNDNRHRHFMHYFAYQYLKSALKNPKGVYSDAEVTFRRTYNQYDEKLRMHLEKELKIPERKYAKKELEYRQWALKNRLFINPLNDLPIIENYFATDVLHLPDMTVNIEEKPALPGLYNQLKQEYIFSRYLYYESIQPNAKVHFADKENFVYQFADYPTYSIRIEKMKTAYRLLYSIFDKVAFFLNRYFDLGLSEGAVYFKGIWKTTKFVYMINTVENSALNSLYWINKELFDKDGSFYTNPFAKRMNDIRNALEHKYVKVYNDEFPARVNGEIDDMALYISETELEKMTMDILKLIREVLIYLSLAVHIEESKRYKVNDATYCLPVSFLKYDDNWKV